jgi:hypothetical protein
MVICNWGIMRYDKASCPLVNSCDLLMSLLLTKKGRSVKYWLLREC